MDFFRGLTTILVFINPFRAGKQALLITNVPALNNNSPATGAGRHVLHVVTAPAAGSVAMHHYGLVYRPLGPVALLTTILHDIWFISCVKERKWREFRTP